MSKDVPNTSRYNCQHVEQETHFFFILASVHVMQVKWYI